MRRVEICEPNLVHQAAFPQLIDMVHAGEHLVVKVVVPPHESKRLRHGKTVETTQRYK